MSTLQTEFETPIELDELTDQQIAQDPSDQITQTGQVDQSDQITQINQITHQDDSGITFFKTNLKETLSFIKTLWHGLYHEPLKTIKTFHLVQFVISVIYMLLGGLLNGMFIAFAQEFQRQWSRQHPSVELKKFILSDVLFDALPFFRSLETGDLCLTGLIVFAFLRFILCKGRITVLRRFLTLMGTMFYVRFCCLYVSLLNDPSYNQSNVSLNPLFETVMISFGAHVSTVDKMFSGHTASLTLAGLTLIEYHDKYPLFNTKKCNKLLSRLFEIGVVCYCCLGYSLFAMTRIHYSVDIFVAVILATAVFYMYKFYLPLAQTRPNIFNKILMWMEEDADDIPVVYFVDNSIENKGMDDDEVVVRIDSIELDNEKKNEIDLTREE